MKHNNTKQLTAGALLLGLSLVIPLALGGLLGIVIGPFTATLASHVPLFLSMLLGPGIAAVVGGGSALGFFLKLGPVVGFRAAMHIPLGITGALLLRRMKFPAVLAVMAPLHSILEALIVLPFGFSLQNAGFLVGVGTLVHHILDSIIAIILWKILTLTWKNHLFL